MNVKSKTMDQLGLADCAEQAADRTGIRLYNLRGSGKGIAFQSSCPFPPRSTRADRAWDTQ